MIDETVTEKQQQQQRPKATLYSLLARNVKIKKFHCVAKLGQTIG